MSITRRSRAVFMASLACASLLLTACQGEHDKASEETQRVVKLKSLTDACEGIFDKGPATEFRQRHGISQVDVIRDDLLFFAGGGRYLDSAMDMKEGDAVPCGFNDKTGKKRLLEIHFAWGPAVFPESSRRAGKSTVWSSPRTQLMVDCQRPDLARKAKLKKPLALTGTLTDNLGLTQETRQRVMTAATKGLLENMRCDNKISFS